MGKISDDVILFVVGALVIIVLILGLSWSDREDKKEKFRETTFILEFCKLKNLPTEECLKVLKDMELLDNVKFSSIHMDALRFLLRRDNAYVSQQESYVLSTGVDSDTSYPILEPC